MTVVSGAPYKLKINGKLVGNQNSVQQNWTFLNNYANNRNLAERVKKFQLRNSDILNIPFREAPYGDFFSDTREANFQYEIELPIPDDVTSAANVSWLDKSRGLLMLNDVLPQFNGAQKDARVSFVLPDSWKVSSREKALGANMFQVEDTENAVFLVGEDWREKKVNIGGKTINFSISGQWQFSDDDAFLMFSQIYGEYERLLGKVPQNRPQVFLLRFPKKMGFDRWSAETRGANVTIFSSPVTFDSQALQRLHEQLRHEVLHLWLPNGLNLKGDYAWFYEGFVVYQSLKTGVWLERIRFEDFLNTLGNAYSFSNRREKGISLLDISKSRWSESVSSVYAKGMIIAFLCDIAILRKSKARRSLQSVFLEVLRRHGKSQPFQEATPAIIRVLNGYPELRPIVEAYIKGTDKIAWTEYLDLAGIEMHPGQGAIELKVKSTLSRRQKALLKKLGYNRWRKV